jgi:hypothetical protein
MRSFIKFSVAAGSIAALAAFGIAGASHSWGGYHWARTSNPFTLKVGDNVSTAWDAYLDEAIADWNPSSVLNLTKVAGGAGNPKVCKATTGRIEVCNAKYGNTGWLGVAQISITGGTHITKGVAKMNDTYFTTAQYNTPAWRRLVMCQEIAHDFGLDHQDETFDNPNLGTCMDYTNDPDGGAGGASASDPSNEHPNAHDFAQLESIYAHLDTTTTIGQTVGSALGAVREALADTDMTGAAEWGKVIRRDARGRANVFERDFGREKVVTHVFWTE